MASEGFTLRTATTDDAVDVARIFEFYQTLEGDNASFELEVPSVEEMSRRIQQRLHQGLPYIVAEEQDTKKVVGYAYMSQFKPKPAYDHILENSLYIDNDYRGRGLGKILLEASLLAAKEIGCREIMSIVGTKEDNPATVHLHKKYGFEEVGVMKRVGYKWGRYIDRLLLQKCLVDNPVDSAIPQPPPEMKYKLR